MVNIELFRDSVGRNRFWLIENGKRVVAKELLIILSGSGTAFNVAIYDSDDNLIGSRTSVTGESVRVELEKIDQGDYIYGYIEVDASETVYVKRVLVKSYNPGDL